jgi:tetratricopeptide (TPR) repeat protein
MMTCELVVAAALLAPGQVDNQDKPVDPLGGLSGGLRQTAKYQTVRQAADEQIEVMRALLRRKLGSPADVRSYGWTADAFAPANPTQQHQSSPFNSLLAPTADAQYNTALQYYGQNRWQLAHDEPAVEAVYLDGVGAVFTVTLPATGRDPRPGSAGPKEVPGLTEWEKAQRALRGEPVPEKAAAAPKEPAVGDVILKLLADNGQHLTAVKNDERVVIAVTFRGPTAVRPPQVLTNLRDTTSSSNSTLSGTTTGGTATSSGTVLFGGPTAIGRNAADGQDQELLADLHLKQGQPQQAIDVLHKAIKQAEAELAMAGDDTAHIPRAARLANLLAKLANAQLAAGKEDEARASLDRAKGIREKPAKPANPAAKAANRLPARLTISAPKKLLDEVGGGKMSLDEFRKQVTVDYVPAQ